MIELGCSVASDIALKCDVSIGSNRPVQANFVSEELGGIVWNTFATPIATNI
jgi:hypothetical protein